MRTHRRACTVASILVAVFLASCTERGEIVVCERGRFWESCRTFPTAEALARYEDARRAKALEVAKALDIDYQSCSGVVLADQLRDQPPGDAVVYASVLGGDPAQSVLDSLRAVNPRTLPRSAKPKGGTEAPSAPDWNIEVAELQKRWFGGYEAIAGYYCGPLCAGTFRYRLERDGTSCKVLSKELLAVS